MEDDNDDPPASTQPTIAQVPELGIVPSSNAKCDSKVEMLSAGNVSMYQVIYLKKNQLTLILLVCANISNCVENYMYN